MRHRWFLLPMLAALSATALVLPSAPAGADVVNVWTTYSSISACKADLLNLNNFCYGLRDGQAIGLIDAALTVDELGQSLGVRYDDENTLPAPEGPANPVVEVWNNTSDYTFIAAGTSVAADFSDGVPIYYIAPHADSSGPAIDADAADASYGDVSVIIITLTLNFKVNIPTTEY